MRIPSPLFWEVAIGYWKELDYGMPKDQPAAHREAVGATPVLARHTTKNDMSHHPQLIRLLKRCNLIYLSDWWNMSQLEWIDDDEVGQLVAHHRPASGVTLLSELLEQWTNKQWRKRGGWRNGSS